MKTKENGSVYIEIPYLPKSLNRVLRMHRMVWEKYFTKCKNDVWALMYEKGNKRPKKPYQKAKLTMTFVFPDKGIRDMDNLIGGSKGIVDGIRAAKIIEDDCWQKLEFEFKGELGKKAMTCIEIKEMKL